MLPDGTCIRGNKVCCIYPALQISSFHRFHRQFITSKYPFIKQHNPDLPVLIREASGTPARVFARFGVSVSCLCIAGVDDHVERGREVHVDLDNLSATDVESKVTQLLSS